MTVKGSLDSVPPRRDFARDDSKHMRIKKAILTGGGRATRLRPITTTINKHLIPLANKPMIFHAIEKAVEAGITDIFINTNPGETQLQQHIGDGGHWGVNITFYEQTGGPQGVAHIAKCAEKFIGNDPFLFYFSDNIMLGSLVPLLEKFEREENDCQLAFAQVPDPERFGVPLFSPSGQLLDVWEKPAKPPSKFAQTGIYLYDHKVFFEAFDNITKSARGEYEISDIHSFLLKHNYRVGYQEVSGWWKDTGKPDDLLAANQLLLDEMPADKFKIAGQVSPAAQISDKVQIGASTTVGDNVKIIGPVIIGENCCLENCVINPYTTIGSGSIVRDASIGYSLVLSNCSIECPLTISGSIIGANVIIKKNGQQDGHHLILGDHTLLEM